MRLSQLDKNLLLFLDPSGHYSEQSWNYIDAVVGEGKTLLSSGRNIIISFSRDQLFAYYINSLKQFFFRRKTRKVFFINDGLLRSIFDASSTSAYKSFAENHLPKPRTLRQQIVALLPLVLRAETRFIIVYAQPQTMNYNNSEFSGLDVNDFMFFSNAAGKLLLTTTETLQTGHGQIIKTTTDPEYAAVLEKEYDLVALLSVKLGTTGSLPVIGKHFEAGGRHFFTEEYILGESLRERLRVLVGQRDYVKICNIIDSLDEWFHFYNASFTGDAIPVSTVYNHLFSLFSECYGATGISVLQTGIELLRQFEKVCPFVVPITAHNDLWPGNFVVTENGFIVIDWERATENRAPFFDYFWLIISTAIESLASEVENINYSEATRRLLRCEDVVSCHALQKLKTFLNNLGISEDHLLHLLFLFFMEWSVQGFQTLGRQTDMDRLAFGELLHYAEQLRATGQRLTFVAPSIRVTADA